MQMADGPSAIFLFDFLNWIMSPLSHSQWSSLVVIKGESRRVDEDTAHHLPRYSNFHCHQSGSIDHEIQGGTG